MSVPPTRSGIRHVEEGPSENTRIGTEFRSGVWNLRERFGNTTSNKS